MWHLFSNVLLALLEAEHIGSSEKLEAKTNAPTISNRIRGHCRGGCAPGHRGALRGQGQPP